MLLNKDRTIKEIVEYLKKEEVFKLLNHSTPCFVNTTDNEKGAFIRVFQERDLRFAVKCETEESEKEASRVLVVAALIEMGYKVEHPTKNHHFNT